MGSRLFTAVLPSVRLVEELDLLLEPRRGVDAAVRWTRPEGWHLTTSFMADVEPALVDGLGALLAGVAAKVPRFRVGVEGGLAFPDPHRAKVLALAVSEGGDELARLSAGARRAASRMGIDVDGMGFVPHLTVARSRGVSAGRWLGVLDSFPGWSWEVEEICLVESHSVGRRYEVLGRYPLG